MCENNFLKLSKLVKSFPKKPGCYLFHGLNNQVLYVGKAKNLFNRTNQYFKKTQNNRLNYLINETETIKYIITDSEPNALILESQLIKKYLPKYNILLKDDKSYPYIVITNETYPKLTFIRQLNIDKKTKYLKMYGPFPNGYHVLEIISILNQVFPFRKCQQLPKVPCLYYHLNQCLGPCIKEKQLSFQDYKQMILAVDSFFKGNDKVVQNYLKKRMQIFSDKLDFENANKLKILSLSIKNLLAKEEIEIKDNKIVHFIGHYYQNQKLSVYIVIYNYGKFWNYIAEIIDEFVDIETTINNFLRNFYQKNNLPNKFIFDSNLKISDKYFQNINKLIPKANKYREILDLANKNAKEYFIQNELKHDIKNKISEDVLDSLKDIFNFEKNKNITFAMVDTSHLQGSNYVGGVSYFINLDKISYSFRKFQLSEITQSDDAYAIKLTLIKYFKQLKNWPDIIFLDGGKIQLNVALNLKKKLLKQYPKLANLEFASLVKNLNHQTDKLLLQSREINIKENTHLFLFLSKVQEITHNYIISYYRKKHRENIYSSELNDIKGLGKKSLMILKQNFQTIEDIKNASLETLTKALAKNIALKVYNHFHK